MRAAAFTLRFLLLLCLIPSGFSFASAPPTQPLVILVVGAAGEESFQPIFAKSEKLWREAAANGGAEVVTIGLDGDATAITNTNATPSSTNDADRRALQKILERLRATNSAPAWIVLIGHGTDNGKEAKFNLRGPDFSAAELAEWLKPAQRPLVIVNTTSSSGAFIKPLSATNRIIVTATRSGGELNFAHFGAYMAEAVGSPEADLDKDEQTSLLEAFLMASRRVADFYKEEGRIATEHALVEDNGDGLGTPADWFKGVRAVKKAQKGQGVDGRRAHQVHLISNATDQKLSATDRAKRDALELKLAELRDQKATLARDAYYRDLESILLELAKLYETGEAVK